MKRIVILGSPRHSKQLMLAIYKLSIPSTDVEVISNDIAVVISALGISCLQLSEASKQLTLAVENFNNIKSHFRATTLQVRSVIPQKYYRGKNNFKKRY